MTERPLVVAMKHGGTHFVRELFRGLRLKRHKTDDETPYHRLYVVKRDPRALLVSRFRWILKENRSKARTLRRRHDNHTAMLVELINRVEYGRTPIWECMW